MANRTKFAGFYRALDFYYGGPNINNSPAPLVAVSAPGATGAGTIALATGEIVLTDGTRCFPLATTAPILVGSGSNQETVTPSAVSNPTLTVPGQASFTATLANLHGQGDPIASGTCGLQEAINQAASDGGGVVVVDAFWTQAGGTNAMITAAVYPTAGTVTILDNRAGGGGVASSTVTVANAQVLTNNTVPTVVLPIPPAGCAWDIIDLFVENKNLGVAYTGGGVMALYYGTSSSGILASATIAAAFLTSPTAAQVIKVAGALATNLASGVLAKGVVFTNPTADFAAGTGTLILKVSARLLTGL